MVCCLIESLLLLFHRQLGSADFTLTTIDAGGHIAIVNCQRSALIALMCALSYMSTTILGRFLYIKWMYLGTSSVQFLVLLLE